MINLSKALSKRFSKAGCEEKMSVSSNPNPIKTVSLSPPPWDSGMVLVCDRCLSKSKASKASLSRGEDLASWLKARLAKDRLRGNIRVITTSCLNICERGLIITVVIGSDAGGEKCFAVDPTTNDWETLYNLIKERIK